MIDLVLGDCSEVMRAMPPDSFDAVVTDPPAGIRFMGTAWDTFPTRGKRAATTFKDGRSRPGVAEGQEHRKSDRAPFVAFMTAVMAECLRLAKPGAHALVWAIPRTSHWTGTAIEDAGWDVEDRITHHFGTGFPKHKSKLKPATEDWWLATRPGGKKWLNVDGCRIGTSKEIPGSPSKVTGFDGYGKRSGRTGRASTDDGYNPDLGRWPANLVLSHSPECDLFDCVDGCPVALLDGQSGVRTSGTMKPGQPRKATLGLGGYGQGFGEPASTNGSYGDSGGASHFFYCSKASKTDRDPGNTHPTVKSTDLMQWLLRLVTPAGGRILDPFAGSGSTLKAAIREGLSATGIEQDPGYYAIARARIVTEMTSAPPKSRNFALSPMAEQLIVR